MAFQTAIKETSSLRDDVTNSMQNTNNKFFSAKSQGTVLGGIDEN